MKSPFRDQVRLSLCLILGFLFFSFLVPYGLQGAERPFRIGFVVPLTGAFGKDGALVRDAYLFWKETVNTQGGIEVGGKRFPIELTFYDDKSEPQTSAKLVEKLITEDRVDLLLGEPSLGLQPLLVERTFEAIKEINRRGVAILLVEQNVQLSLEMSHRAYVLEDGRMALEGKAADLLQSEHIRKFYLAM